MLNSLASYLLGTSTAQQAVGGVEERNVRLTSVISEDDWVLVDRDSEGNSEVDSSSTESLDRYGAPDTRPALPPLLTRSSSTASLPCTTMEESWFVTPPPCFTSAGPVHMETSPLENLLIEHPSMSVYQHSHPALVQLRTSVQTPTTDCSDEEETEEALEEVPPVQRARPTETRERNRQLQTPRVNLVNTLRNQEEQWTKNKQAQKVQLQKACQSLKRRYLERANKAREVNYRNRRQRRSERCQGATRSYANNNRKC